MWKNNCNLTSYSLTPMIKSPKSWKTSLDWFLISERTQKFPKGHFEKDMSISKDIILFEQTPDKYRIEAEEGIARIQDPLWRRVCIDILQILGPVAFKDLWKNKLITVSPQKRRVYLACPNQAMVETIEKYHFVIIAALKKFYPFLCSIELEISKE